MSPPPRAAGGLPFLKQPHTRRGWHLFGSTGGTRRGVGFASGCSGLEVWESEGLELDGRFVGLYIKTDSCGRPLKTPESGRALRRDRCVSTSQRDRNTQSQISASASHQVFTSLLQCQQREMLKSAHPSIHWSPFMPYECTRGRVWRGGNYH